MARSVDRTVVANLERFVFSVGLLPNAYSVGRCPNR